MRQIMKANDIVYNFKYGFYLLLLFMVSSCDSIDEDLDPCGLDLRFVYDYNIKYVDLFAVQVDRVDVFIFDKDGVFISKQTEQQEDLLSADNYRMRLNLPLGEYKIATWAGLSDDYLMPDLVPGSSKLDSDFILKLKRNSTSIIDKDLHPLWYGEIQDVKVSGSNQTVTVPLMKDTKKVRIIIRTDSYDKRVVEPADAQFEILYNNGFYNWDNTLLADNQLSYRPYVLRDTTEEDGFYNVITEMSTMRLFEKDLVNLKLTKISTGQVLLDYNLIDLLLLLKFDYMNTSNQEYLDRSDEFVLTFLYDSGRKKFVSVQITVNAWTQWYQLVDLH